MARGRSRGTSADTNAVASLDDELLGPVSRPSRVVSPVSIASDFRPFVASEVQDLRRFDFNEPFTSPVEITGIPAAAVERLPAAAQEPGRVIAARPAPAVRVYPSFANAAFTLICLRRKERREVLFARGGRGGGRRHYSWRSLIRC